MSSSGGPGFLAGAALGVLLGGALGILFAPRSGEQTRRALAARGATRAAEDESPWADGDAAPTTELFDLGVGALDASIDRLGRAYDAAREAAVESRTQLSEEWAQTKRQSS